MKLPSLSYLLGQIQTGFKNFPTTILCAITGSLMLIYWVEFEAEIDNEFPILNSVLTCAIGLPLFFSVSIFNRHKSFNLLYSSLMQLLVVLALVLIYFSLPDQDITLNRSVPYIRYVIYNITAHLLVAFVPYINKRQLNGFWNYNKLLFIRFLTSLLYSAVLYLGIVFALVALNALFDAEIREDTFLEVYILIQGIFNTWFFTAGIPLELNQLEKEYEYPKGLKIFTQYILLPLLTFYLLILYFYGAKIVLVWDWPKGIVSYLIICVAVAGIFEMLLLYPYGVYLKGNEWIKKLSRAYYFLLIPLLVMLFIAISMRIGDYGLTINRYIIVLLGVWLSFICLYFSSGRKNIKLIPMSLAGLILMVSFGPWSMFSVSESSQVNRLKNYLIEGGILENGKIQNEIIWQKDNTKYFEHPNAKINEGMLSDSIHNEVISIMRYLDDHHGFKGIKNWFNQDLDSIILIEIKLDEYSDWRNEASVYLNTMGLSDNYKYSPINTSVFIRREPNGILLTKGYDYLFNFYQYGNYESHKNEKTQHLDSAHTVVYSLKHNMDASLEMVIGNDSISLALGRFLYDLHANYGKEDNEKLPQTKLSKSWELDKYDIKLVFETIQFINRKDSVELGEVQAKILFTMKED